MATLLAPGGNGCIGGNGDGGGDGGEGGSGGGGFKWIVLWCSNVSTNTLADAHASEASHCSLQRTSNGCTGEMRSSSFFGEECGMQKTMCVKIGCNHEAYRRTLPLVVAREHRPGLNDVPCVKRTNKRHEVRSVRSVRNVRGWASGRGCMQTCENAPAPAGDPEHHPSDWPGSVRLLLQIIVRPCWNRENRENRENRDAK